MSFGKERADRIRDGLANLSPGERDPFILNELATAIQEMGGEFVLPFRFMCGRPPLGKEFPTVDDALVRFIHVSGLRDAACRPLAMMVSVDRFPIKMPRCCAR
ncbi:hypothetical protein A6A04_19135 [Paramagnetospirillum marisnigri]|uniref:Uncharacterized protein n=1 Tax=Paramagnetospirillum marisnigri TaxID=1285242 RepID=A0A178MLP4_9PROT|nr:hypothetical protein A6A04_19135 [Paramagnetospirillum marisnigri]